MKKVLFIIQSYPSNRSANVICDEKIMKAMIDSGKYEIHCLAYRFHGQKLYEEINGFKVHRFKRGHWWNLYTYARDNESQPLYKAIVKLNRLYMRFRQFCCIPIYPNYEPILAKLVAKNAIELYRKEQYDLIIAEHSGRDTLYGGMKVKERFPNVRFIPILWDPLSGRQPAKYLPIKYAEKRIEEDEKFLLKNADRVICLQSNEEYQRQHSAKKSFFKNLRFLDIPGIIHPTIHPCQEGFTKKGRINILYSGILTLPDRNPSAFIRIIKQSKFADRINIMFFSAGIDGKECAKRELADFKGTWLVHPYIPKSQLNTVAANSDVFLNIGGPNPVMVPSKIFEYMSLGKPIVSTYYIDNESSRKYFDSYPLSCCLDIRKSEEELVVLFDEFISNQLNKTVPFDSVQKAFPRNTPAEFIKVFEEVL